MLREDHTDYRDIWDDSTVTDDGATLKELSATFRFSKVKAVVLTKHEWKLTRTVPAKEEWNIVGEAEESAELVEKKSLAKDADEGDQSDIKSPLGQPSPRQTKGAELPDPRRKPVADATVERGTKRTVPFHLDYNSPRYRRKAICVHCWEGRTLCDFNGQCATCRNDKVKCVRRSCDDGLSCRNRRCPCLHPGQWDESDASFVVEPGRMPTRRQHRPLPLPPGDFYRPGE